MKSAGIICECNPFHSGHKHLIRQARASGANAVVCLMSGYFTQRGEVAISDPYTRAEALIRGGADLVLELPFPYSSGGAEFFANAGVDILFRLGVDELWFGSECGDLDRLSHAAKIVRSEEFCSLYAEKNNSNSFGTAQAYFDALGELCKDGQTFASNDTLGIAYLCALNKKQSQMRPVTIKRKGSAYLDDTLHENGHPSATALRRLILTQGVDRVRPRLLPETADALKKSMSEGLAPANLSHAERAILAYLRLSDPDRLSALAELGGGLGNRLIEAAQEATSLEELLSIASTKKYPLARLRRGILFAMTGVTKQDLKAPPAYVRVLSANATGCAYLAEKRRSSNIVTVTRQSDLPNDENAMVQEKLHRRALSLFTLCLHSPAKAHDLLRRNPSILK